MISLGGSRGEEIKSLLEQSNTFRRVKFSSISSGIELILLPAQDSLYRYWGIDGGKNCKKFSEQLITLRLVDSSGSQII